MLGEPVGVELLDGAADQTVKLAAPLDQQRAVCHVLGERVLEHVGELGVAPPFVDELEHGQLAQALLGAVANVSEAVDEPARELAAHHRSDL